MTLDTVQGIQKVCDIVGIPSADAKKLLRAEEFLLLPDESPSSRVGLCYLTDNRLLQTLPFHRPLIVLAPLGLDVPRNETFIKVADPSLVFWSLVEVANQRAASAKPTEVHASAKIHESASVASKGVSVGAESVIGPGVRVCSGVTIGERVVIGPNSVLGNDGFMVKRTIRGLVRVPHEAGVQVSDEVIISSLVNIDAGIFGTPTKIGFGTKIDAGVHIAHCVSLGKENVIAARAQVAGWVTTDESVFIGVGAAVTPRVRLGRGAFVGASALVATDIEPGGKAYGRPAVILRGRSNTDA